MAGWFEALASVLGGMGAGLDRYTVMRRLDEQNKFKMRQQEFENQLALQNQQRQQDLFGLEKQRLENAILKQKQDQLTSLFNPGQNLDPSTVRQFEDAKLGGLVHKYAGTNPLEKTGLPIYPGTRFTLDRVSEEGDPFVTEVPDAPKFLVGNELNYNLPQQGYSEGARYMGTPDQQLKQFTTMLPIARQNALTNAIMGMSGVDARTKGLMALDAMDGNFSAGSFLNRNPYGNSTAGSMASALMNGDQAGYNALLKAQTDLSKLQANQDPNLARMRQLQIEKLQEELDQDNARKQIDPTWNLMIGRSIMNIPAYRQGEQAKIMTQLARAGQWDNLRSVIRQAAVEGEQDATSRNKVTGRMAALAQVDIIENELNKLERKGISSGILNGSLENILNWMGKTKDPDIVAARSVIEQAMMTYRQSMSGAAFSGKEAEQYANVYPNYLNERELNWGLLRGLRTALKGNQDAYWDFKLGPEGVKLMNGVIAVYDGRPFIFDNAQQRDEFYRRIQAAQEGVN